MKMSTDQWMQDMADDEKRNKERMVQPVLIPQIDWGAIEKEFYERAKGEINTVSSAREDILEWFKEAIEKQVNQ